MAEWIFEAGIGEDRAALIEGGEITEARIERPGLRAGTVAEARLTSILMPGRRGIATLSDSSELLIEPLTRATEGAAIRIEIVREAIPEAAALKRAKGRIVDDPLRAGPTLRKRIGPHHVLGMHEADLLEQAGWSECLESAASGIVAFDGGTLRISCTPAMTLIDVDGNLPHAALAIAGAKAAARSIRRFDIAGNIGIDLPTSAGKSTRKAIGDAFDAVLPLPYERTAVNGFGFLQVIRPRVRASLQEIIRQDRASHAARALLRRVQRSNFIGSIEIAAASAVIDALEANEAWIAQVEAQMGGKITLARNFGLSLDGGVVAGNSGT